MANETLNGLKAGDKAPDFELPGDDGKTHKLSDHKGQPVILYFYPRDNTPGCTTEACEFRDNLNRVTGKGAVVYGVSKDSIKSHEKFRDKYDLNFPLLADEDVQVMTDYGVWGEKKLYGKVSMGCIRSTFLIDKDGNFAEVWTKVRVKGHVDKVLEALEAL